MDALYYKVIGFVLLFPWMLMGLAVVGHLRARWTAGPSPTRVNPRDREGRPGMDTRIAPLAAFTDAIAAGQPERFGPAVRAAYAAGAEPEDLLLALDMTRVLDEVPASIVTHAYAAIYVGDWHWIAARRAESRRELARQAA